MTEKYAEKISMLMDDELYDHDTANLIEGIKHDEWLKQCWERYHLISDAMKNNLPTIVKHDLAGRVSRALSSEHAFHLPAVKLRKPSSKPSYVKPAIGLALAASVALVAVLIVPWNNAQVPSRTAAPQAQYNTAQLDGGFPANGRVVADGAVEQPAVAHAGPGMTRELKVEPVLYDYLLDHNEYTDAASVQSTMLPYVRIVGFTSNAPADKH